MCILIAIWLFYKLWSIIRACTSSGVYDKAVALKYKHKSCYKLSKAANASQFWKVLKKHPLFHKHHVTDSTELSPPCCRFKWLGILSKRRVVSSWFAAMVDNLTYLLLSYPQLTTTHTWLISNPIDILAPMQGCHKEDEIQQKKNGYRDCARYNNISYSHVRRSVSLAMLNA